MALPELAQPVAEQWLQRLDEARQTSTLPTLPESLREQALHVFACSDYVARTCQRWQQRDRAHRVAATFIASHPVTNLDERRRL